MWSSAISRSADAQRMPGVSLMRPFSMNRRQVPLLVGALLPADAVAGALELEGTRLAELVAEARSRPRRGTLSSPRSSIVYLRRARLRASRLPQSRCTVTIFSRDLDRPAPACRSPARRPVRGNVSVSPCVMPMPPPTVTFQPTTLALLDDGDVAEVVREDVDVVVDGGTAMTILNLRGR